MLIWKKDWAETGNAKEQPSGKASQAGNTGITGNRGNTRKGGRKSEVDLPAADPSKAVKK